MEEEIKQKKEYLEKYIDYQLEGFKGRAKYNRSASIRQHGLVTFLGAAITILSGLDIEVISEYVRITVLVLGAVITVIGAYKTFFNNKDLWVENTMICNRLHKIKNDFNFYITGKELSSVAIEDIEEFKKEMDKILIDANSYWKNKRQKE